MTTRDTMELREDAIKAQYEAALALLSGFDLERILIIRVLSGFFACHFADLAAAQSQHAAVET